MRGRDVLMSSVVNSKDARDDWGTPADLFAALDAEFLFQLDAAASADNAMTPCFYDELDDALSQSWCVCRDTSHAPVRSVWLNCPYSLIKQFMAKAQHEARNGVNVVCLVPARTDTQWWADYATQAAEIRFIEGRLRFSGGRHSAPFPSAIIVFRAGGQWPLTVSWIDRQGKTLCTTARK